MKHGKTGAFVVSLLLIASCAAPSAAAKIDYSDKEVISLLQSRLNAAGLDSGTPDGVAGAKTMEAIRKYREREGLEEGTGIDAELFNSLMLDQEEQDFVRAVSDLSGRILEPGQALQEVTLWQYDLCIQVDKGSTGQAAGEEGAAVDQAGGSGEAAALADAFTEEILKLEDYEYLWDTITLCYGGDPPVTNGKNSGVGVSPEIRAFLNEYEGFMDEYCSFLETYDENDFTAQTKYLSLTRKYAEYTQKAEDLDQSELSETDAAYYLDVMTRAQKRLDGVTRVTARVAAQ